MSRRAFMMSRFVRRDGYVTSLLKFGVPGYFVVVLILFSYGVFANRDMEIPINWFSGVYLPGLLMVVITAKCAVYLLEAYLSAARRKKRVFRSAFYLMLATAGGAAVFKIIVILSQ